MIARDAGLWLVGLAKEGLAVLSPVFELGMQVQGTPQGIQVTYGAHALLLCPSMTEEWALSPHAQWWPVKGCTIEKQVLAAIKNAEAQLQGMRLAASGLVAPSAMPKMGGRS